MTNLNDRIKGTQTEQNLINAFAGESQARNRYTMFSKIAKQEGYEQIAAIFLETADNERVHAKQFYRHIGNTMGHVDYTYPFELGTTAENLQSAIDGEHEEIVNIYKNAAIIAKEEGFDDIANTFHQIIGAEKHHERRYRQILAVLNENKIFQKDEDVEWTCRKCGYIHYGKTPPEKCPACHHVKAFYQILCEKY